MKAKAIEFNTFIESNFQAHHLEKTLAAAIRGFAVVDWPLGVGPSPALERRSRAYSTGRNSAITSIAPTIWSLSCSSSSAGTHHSVWCTPPTFCSG